MTVAGQEQGELVIDGKDGRIRQRIRTSTTARYSRLAEREARGSVPELRLLGRQERPVRIRGGCWASRTGRAEEPRGLPRKAPRVTAGRFYIRSGRTAERLLLVLRLLLAE